MKYFYDTHLLAQISNGHVNQKQICLTEYWTSRSGFEKYQIKSRAEKNITGTKCVNKSTRNLILDGEKLINQ